MKLRGCCHASNTYVLVRWDAPRHTDSERDSAPEGGNANGGCFMFNRRDMVAVWPQIRGTCVTRIGIQYCYWMASTASARRSA